MARFVLLIGDSGAIIARLSGRSVVSHSNLEGALEDNIESAAKILNASSSVPLVILFDVLGQAYRRERIPLVNILDRSKIVARKLEQMLPGVEFRGALHLGATPGEARSSEYLFASVTPAPEISAWRKLLDRISNPIDDARLLPAESARLTDRLAARVASELGQVSSWRILVTQHRTGGFRQIVVHNGQLAMTRMTPGFLDMSSPEEAGEILHRELSATLGYITRLGFDRAEGLDAIFIGHPDMCGAVRKAQLPVRRLSAFSPAEAEALAGLSGTVDASGHFTDLLHAAWGGGALLSEMPVLPADKRQKRLIEVAQSWGARLAFALSMIGAIYGGALAMELYSRQDELNGAAARQAEMQSRYDAGVTKLEDGPVAVRDIRNVLGVHDQLNAGRADFNGIFAHLDEALGNSIRLRSLLAQAAIPAPELPAVGIDSDDAESTAAPLESAIEGKLLLVIDLNAFSDVEYAVGEVESLAGRLRAGLPEMKTTIVRQPLQILPGDTLSITSTGPGLAFPAGSKIAEIQMTGRLQ